MAKKKNDKYLNNNENLPISVSIAWTEEMLLEYKRCKEDVFYFAENYFFIRVLGKGRQTIKLYEPQKEAIRKIIDNSYTIVCASRQIGKSTIMTVICLWYALFKKDFFVAVLANKEDIAKEILERIKLAYQELPNWLKSGVWEFTKEHVTLTNGSKIEVSTTSSDAVRGKSIDLLFLDEFAHVRKEIAEDFYKSVIPTITSSESTKLVITSTPKGVDNKYYQIYSEAEKGRNGWSHIKIYWHQIPGRDEKWKAKVLALINYDMNLWNQEYDIQFLEDGTAAINGNLIEKLKAMCCPPKFTFDFGDYMMWEKPKPNHIYVIGVDVAEGVGQDNSVANIIDITDPTNMEQVAKFCTNRLQPYVFAEKLNQIARSWGRPFLCIERNKEGGQVVDALWEIHKYENIIHYTMKNDGRGVYQNLGIFCHQNSKYTGIMNMKYFVEHLEAVKIYDMTTVKEFETFVRKENKTWGAKQGFKDDHIMSLIWALILLEKAIAEKYLEVTEYDDTGKPCRILDPNQELANIALFDGSTNNSYVRSGGSPTFTSFSRGMEQRGSMQEHELAGFLGTGWKVV